MRGWLVFGGLAFLCGALAAALFFSPQFGELVQPGGGGGAPIADTQSFSAALDATDRAAMRARLSIERNDRDIAVGAIADVRANLHDARSLAPRSQQATLEDLDAMAMALAARVRDRRSGAPEAAAKLEGAIAALLATTPGNPPLPIVAAVVTPTPTPVPSPVPTAIPTLVPNPIPTPRLTQRPVPTGTATPGLRIPSATFRPRRALPLLPAAPVPTARAARRTPAQELSRPLMLAEDAAVKARRAISDQNWVLARDQLDIARVQLAQALPWVDPNGRQRIDFLDARVTRLMARLGTPEAATRADELVGDIAATQQAYAGGGGGIDPSEHGAADVR